MVKCKGGRRSVTVWVLRGSEDVVVKEDLTKVIVYVIFVCLCVLL